MNWCTRFSLRILVAWVEKTTTVLGRFRKLHLNLSWSWKRNHTKKKTLKPYEGVINRINVTLSFNKNSQAPNVNRRMLCSKQRILRSPMPNENPDLIKLVSVLIFYSLKTVLKTLKMSSYFRATKTGRWSLIIHLFSFRPVSFGWVAHELRLPFSLHFF